MQGLLGHLPVPQAHEGGFHRNTAVSGRKLSLRGKLFAHEG
jgi:hypothetical protein